MAAVCTDRNKERKLHGVKLQNEAEDLLAFMLRDVYRLNLVWGALCLKYSVSEGRYTMPQSSTVHVKMNLLCTRLMMMHYLII